MERIFGFLKKKPNYPQVERRKESRYEADDEFSLEFRGRESHFGNSRDISIHGIRFVTTSKLKVKDKIILNFKLPARFPGEKMLTVQARVIRIYRPKGVARYRVGCSLEHTSESTKEIMRQLIQWLNRRNAVHKLDLPEIL